MQCYGNLQKHLVSRTTERHLVDNLPNLMWKTLAMVTGTRSIIKQLFMTYLGRWVNTDRGYTKGRLLDQYYIYKI